MRFIEIEIDDHNIEAVPLQCINGLTREYDKVKFNFTDRLPLELSFKDEFEALEYFDYILVKLNG